MSAFSDIAAPLAYVEINQSKIRVVGWSATAIAVLLQRYSGLKDAFQKGFPGIVAFLRAEGDDAVAAALAWSVDEGGNAETEADAKRLALAYQLEILKTSFDLTFPRGFEDFLLTLGLSDLGVD